MMNRRTWRAERRARRGSASVAALMVVVMVASLAAGILVSTLSSVRERDARAERQWALQMANTGASHAIANLLNEDDTDDGDLGTADEPLVLGRGRYWVDVEPGEDGVYTLLSLIHI